MALLDKILGKLPDAQIQDILALSAKMPAGPVLGIVTKDELEADMGQGDENTLRTIALLHYVSFSFQQRQQCV